MCYKTTYWVQELMVGECIFLTVLYSGYDVSAPFLKLVVCYTAVFSVVTQRILRGGALRDDT